MSKTLDVAAITNELSGSAFFSQQADSPTPVAQAPTQPVPTPQTKSPAPKKASPKRVTPKRARVDASVSASTQASMLSIISDETVEEIRKTVKATGREVAFTRLTQEEKNRLSDVVYSLKRQGMKTSENEVLRIALNLLLEDYEASGEAGVLRRVIAALLA